ncbi:arabinan endo-1,5-alpha-L-arabinosidase (plasmid) [Deinococcus taeanensis]|uniref:arabinan endo-1,5-alpha-L-arabinosidase n=1 Tax=Deinococcus taeanensis TaxID=2737050 RepID=UPI001CDB6A14|nr:arabinan endo-1,5-alpha-L-arabinosidase [Deinococcus taeanensis]UBV44906.1 arabinan endo-1,5-alpha-L-arabinosidase [Deinococcus taeanensis]
MALAAGLGSVLALGGGHATQPVLRGDLNLHDPTVLRLPGGFVAMGTGYEDIDGGTLRLKTSQDGLSWTDAGHLGDRQPAWVRTLLGQNPPNLWAPSLVQAGRTTYLYYAASTFGQNTSGIGLMTNAALNPRHPDQGWVDRGLVLASGRGDPFNAIDPARLDTPDGRAWLAFGSFWDGIKLRELDPSTGQLHPARPTTYALASRGGGAIEAASLVQRSGYTYLFVSFDRCCAGLSSTYRIMVGRAKDVTGPYLDRQGRPLLQGGGTPVQVTQGRFVGPGGQEVFMNGAAPFLAYHYYDAEQGGAPQLQTSPLLWDAAGWPSLPPLPQEAHP